MSRRVKPAASRAPASGPLDEAVSGRRRWWLAAATLLVAAAALAAWLIVSRGVRPGGTPAAAREPANPLLARERTNLLLVTLDTARADRIGCYGHAAARTRHLDRLAAEGVRFEQVVSPAPITLPAHASLLTALYPPSHGVRNNGNFYLPETLPTLATALKAEGYRTAAFVSAFVLDRRYGLGRGFDVYDDAMDGAQLRIVSLEAERRGDRTALALSAWLEQQSPDAPFFAWLHLYDPHEPYRPPRPFRDLFAHDLYDGELAFDDAVVASVLDALGRRGLLDRTLVAVTADHGESLGDHGEETHALFLYEAAIRVPLILWRPGLLPAGRVVGTPARLTDVAPTLLELLGAPALPAPDGRSLVAAIQGREAAAPPPAYSETYVPQLYMGWAPLRAIRDERYKLIEAPRPELYDLRADPGERSNLHARQPRLAQAMREALERAAGAQGGIMNAGAVDAETAEKLAALGYLGAGAAPAVAAAGAPDPKDRIAVFNRLRRANSAVRERRFDQALRALRPVLAEDPGNAFARLVTASAYLGMGRHRDAIGWYRKYLELVPGSAWAHQWIALCHVRLGEREAALRETAAALVLEPRFADARVLRAGVLASGGAYDAAVAELRAALATDPGKATLHFDLARVLDEAGRRDEARAEYEAVLRLEPEHKLARQRLAALARP